MYGCKRATVQFATWVCYTCITPVLVHGKVTIIFVVSVCLSVCLSVFVCLCRVFLSRLRSDLDQTRTHVTCPGLVVSPRIWGCATLGGWVILKNLYFRGFGAAVNHHSVAASSY